MALSYVGGTASPSAEATLPTYTAGDLALVHAYRDGSNSPPSLATGWTDVASSGANTNASRVGYRVLQAGDTTSGTWTNATEVQVHVLRGQHLTTPIGGNAAGGANNSNQLSYTGFTLTDTGGTSWVVGMAGHRTAGNVNAKAVTAMTTRSGSVVTLGAHTAEGVSTFATSNYTTTVDASAAWRSYAVEVRASVVTQTGNAELGLPAAQEPETRTDHVVRVRARKLSAAHSGNVQVELSDGLGNVCWGKTSELTTSFADYDIALDDGDVANLASYSNLSLIMYGWGPLGDPVAFEVSSVHLSIPNPASGTQYGASVSSFSVGITTSGSTEGAGAKQTGTARLSLASGFTPATDTGHQVSLRARKTAAGAAATIRAQLYEGAVPIADMESGTLGTAFAAYTLSVPEAGAATILSYADLELRLRGYCASGSAAVFEISEASLVIPASTTSGSVSAQATLSSIASISVGLEDVVYPGTAVYPHSLVSVTAISAISAAVAATTAYGRSAVPLSVSLYSAGDIPPDRTGSAALASTATLTAAGATATLAAAVVSATSEVLASGAEGVDHTDAAVLSSTATVTAAGTITSPPAPPAYIPYFDTLPDLLAAVAFDDSPQDPFPTWTDIAAYMRALTTRRGRQFELDRVETGELATTLSNLDGRFSPENTSSPYYGDLIPTRRIRVGMQWGTADPADIFNGYLEGYPQEFPATGADSIVQQRALDAFLSLSMTKFVPGSTFLLANILTAPTTSTQETIQVGNTGLPMPQTVPFTIRIDDEEMTVDEIVDRWSYRVTRSGETAIHYFREGLTGRATAVTTAAISFGSEYSDERIRHVLERIGLSASEYDLEPGQTLLAPSADLAGQSPLEHINLVAEAEGGRFFAAANGKLTFHSRHHQFKYELASRATFGDGGGSELPYRDIRITHEQERIYNIVRITAADGTVHEARDEDSIDDHFERVLEKVWPLADANEALAAAEYLLRRYSRMQVRVPELKVSGQTNPNLLWPYLIAMEIGQRYRVIRRPGIAFAHITDATIDKELIVEGIAHTLTPGRAETTIQMSLADTTHYWRLGVAGYSELGSTTRLVY